jgi:hypothetical protein
VSLKSQIDPNTMVVGDFNTPLSPTDKSFRQKNKKTKKILELKGTIDLMDLTCLQNIPSCNSTIYVLLNIPWNFLQNRSHPRAQSKSQEIQEN